MADRTIAPPYGPESPSAAAAQDGPDAFDLLENTLAQLTSFLWSCHGDGTRWRERESKEHLDNVLWLAWELAQKAETLLQQCASERSAKA
jgi:hypothetical protein